MNSPRATGFWPRSWLALFGALVLPATAQSQPPLHEQIDTTIERAHPGPFAMPCDDADFVRRVYLDLAGVIPTATEVRDFLAEGDAAKRRKLIDRLLDAPEFAHRMADVFDVMLMERRTGGPIKEFDWRSYLREAFRSGKAWDQISREILAVDGLTPESRPAMMFYVARGAESYDVLTRDIGRLFLGVDLQCAHCHDHPSIKDYKQAHYYGIQAYLVGTGTAEAVDNKDLLLLQKKLIEPLEFQSVFTGQTAKTGPRLPGREPVALPTFDKTEDGFGEHARIGKPGTPKFFARDWLAKELTSPDSASFARNIANRLWAMIVGRGLVEPLDLHHSDNPASHPELLELLSGKIVEMKFDLRLFIRELMLTKAYQRSSLVPDNVANVKPESFAVANIKHLSAEQLLASLLRATGQEEIVVATIDEQLRSQDAVKFAALQAHRGGLEKSRDEKLAVMRSKFVLAFANPPGEPEDGFNPTLAGALFFVNERLLAEWLQPQPGNLIERVVKIDDTSALVDELYLSILSRPPMDEERAAAVEHLESQGERRATAVAEVAWGLLASTEFRLNH